MTPASTAVTLTRDEARRLIVRAQLLDAARPGDLIETLEQVGTVKIDPTATIATAEHTALWSRIGDGYEPGQLRKAVDDDRLLYEYAATIRSASMMSLLRVLLSPHALHPRTRAWMEANERFRSDILARLRAEGPLVASAIPDTAQVEHTSESGWYGPSQVPRMLEVLSHTGEVAVTRREGRMRVWDLATRVYPEPAALSPEDASAALDAYRLRAAGLAKHRSPWSRVGSAGTEVRVEGSSWRFRADPDLLATLDDDPGGRVAILNPYDTMLTDRARLTEVFDFTYVLEQFKPKSQRRFGYFAHPVLVGDRFVAMLDAELVSDRTVLRVNALHELEPLADEERDMIHAEITALAAWLGAHPPIFD